MCILSDKIISLSLPLSLVLCSQDSRYNRLRKTSVIKRKARKLTNVKFINKASALWMLFLHPLLLSSLKLATITIVIKDYTTSFFLVTSSSVSVNVLILGTLTLYRGFQYHFKYWTTWGSKRPSKWNQEWEELSFFQHFLVAWIHYKLVD